MSAKIGNSASTEDLPISHDVKSTPRGDGGGAYDQSGDDFSSSLDCCTSGELGLCISASASSQQLLSASSSSGEPMATLSSSTCALAGPVTTASLLMAPAPTSGPSFGRTKYSVLECPAAASESSGPGVLNTYFLDFPGWRTLVQISQPDDSRCFGLLLIGNSMDGEHEDITRGCLYLAGDAAASAMESQYSVPVERSYYWDRELNRWCGRVLCRGEPGVFEIAGVKMCGPAPTEHFRASVGGVPWRSDSQRRAVFLEQRRISMAKYESAWHNDGTVSVLLPDEAAEQ